MTTGDRAARLRFTWAYVRHLLLHRLRPVPASDAEEVLRTYAPDRLRSMTAAEREALPAMSRCIDCGLCALVVRRMGHIRLPDAANAYLRDPTILPTVTTDLDGGDPGRAALAAAAAVCPTGVPLPEIAAMVRRMAHSDRHPGSP